MTKSSYAYDVKYTIKYVKLLYHQISDRVRYWVKLRRALKVANFQQNHAKDIRKKSQKKKFE